MLNWSFSLKAQRCRDEDVVEREEVVPQNVFFSVGEGGMNIPESLISRRHGCTGSAWMSWAQDGCQGRVPHGAFIALTTQFVLDRLFRIQVEVLIASGADRFVELKRRRGRTDILVLFAERILDGDHC
jgi:hypothetical protein